MKYRIKSVITEKGELHYPQVKTHWWYWWETICVGFPVEVLFLGDEKNNGLATIELARKYVNRYKKRHPKIVKIVSYDYLESE